MAAESPRVAPVAPLELRLGLVLPTLLHGAAAAVVLFLGSVAFRLWSQQWMDPNIGPASHGFATRAALIASLSIGYTLIAWRWVPRAHMRDLVEAGLVPESELGVSETRIVGGTPEQVRTSRMAGLVGIALFVVLVEAPTWVAGGTRFEAWSSIHTFTYMLFLGVLLFWIGGRLVYFSLANGSPGDSLTEVDLLDLRPVRALGRIGLRSALSWVIGLSLGSLVFLFQELRFADSLVVFVPLALVTLVVTVASLLLPLRGVHRLLLETRERELAAVEAAIRGEPGALERTRIGDRDGLGLADLLAYKQYVQGIPTWPFDSATLRRLLLYLLIPLGSWLGGAMVERMVSAFLD